MELTKIEALCELANVELNILTLNAINNLNLRDDFNNPEASNDHQLDKIEQLGEKYESAKRTLLDHESPLAKEILRDIEPLLDKLPVLYLSSFTQGSIRYSQQGI